MRIIPYLSLAAALAAGIILATAGASPGDARYVLGQTEELPLTAPQKLAAKTLAQAVFPSLLTGDIEKLTCWQDREGRWSCVASEDGSALTDTNFAELAMGGGVRGAGQKGHQRRRFTDAQMLAAVDTFTQTVWSLSRQEVWSLVLKRDGTDVLGGYSPIKIASKAEFRADWNNNLVAVPLDILTE